jgi:hypothetical protein
MIVTIFFHFPFYYLLFLSFDVIYYYLVLIHLGDYGGSVDSLAQTA